jgi:replicative DNA helicase
MTPQIYQGESNGSCSKMATRINNYCMRPEFGVSMGYPTIDDAFLGLQLGRALFFGFLSNTGKSRMLMNLVCHVAFAQKQKVLVMSNEMDEETWEKAYLTTIINNEEYWDLHGVRNFHKPEREIVLGQYRDDNTGEFMMRRYNHETGESTETEEEYLKRLETNSSEYRNVIKISKWIEEKTNQYVIFKDITEDYSTEAIRFEMQKASMLYGCKYFALDTLKPDVASDVEDWKAFKQTATKLQEFAREMNGCLIANFQLSDSAVDKDPFDLSSMDIASSKGLKTVADYMLLGKRVPRKDYYKYEYLPNSSQWMMMAKENGERLFPNHLTTKRIIL